MDVAPRYQLLRLGVLQVIQGPAIASGDAVAVAAARGHKQQHALAAALEKGVEPYRRPVHEERDVSCVGDDLADTLDDASGRIVGGGRHLAHESRAVGRVDDEIGEGPADIGGYAIFTH